MAEILRQTELIVRGSIGSPTKAYLHSPWRLDSKSRPRACVSPKSLQIVGDRTDTSRRGELVEAAGTEGPKAHIH
jgi:hypothetical protein